MSRIKVKQAKGVGRITLDYGIDQFLRHCRLKNLSPRTIEYYTEDLRYFQRTTEVTYLDEINDRLYEDFILHEMDKGNKMTAVNCRTRGLRVFLRFCAKREYMEPVTIPMMKVRFMLTINASVLAMSAKLNWQRRQRQPGPQIQDNLSADAPYCLVKAYISSKLPYC